MNNRALFPRNSQLSRLTAIIFALAQCDSLLHGEEPTKVAAPTTPTIATANWPTVRGPRFDGHADATPLVNEFPPQGPAVLWTRPLGVGYSSFATDGQRVYTQYQTLAAQYVIALDAASGATIWEHEYELAYEAAGLYPGPRGTPAVVDGRVYFVAPSGLVGCLDAATGRAIWSFNVFERFQAKPVEFGYSCSPTVVAGKVILPVGGPNASLAALDAKSGDTLWQAGGDPISHVPALPIELAGRRLVIGYLRNALIACNLETGAIVGRLKLSDGYDEHAAWPIYREPCLWFSGPFQQGSELLELAAEAPLFRQRWKSRLLSNDVCSSVLVDGFLYGFDIRDPQTKLHRPSRGQFRCLDFETGAQSWANGPAKRLPHDMDDAAPELKADEGPADAIGQASVLVADGKLVMFNDTGELILAKANPERYEELGRASVLGGEICWTSPMLVGGRLYVRNHSRVACVVLAADATANEASPRLTVADIPQTVYRDWAAIIMAVEPEYAMDLPSIDQLTKWWAASTASFAAAVVAAGLCVVTIGGLARAFHDAGSTQIAADVPTVAPPSPLPRAGLTQWFRGVYLALAAALGALGTTLFSAWSGQFIFTWPLSLFVAFRLLIDRAASGAGRSPSRRWTDRLIVCAFLGLCLGYYLLCRRLSLGAEWIFLSGFVAAAPLLAWTRRFHRSGFWPNVVAVLLELLAFTIYYWASVAVQYIRYRS